MKHLKHILFAIAALTVLPVWAQWDGTASPWTQGSGSQQDPYRIENANHLAFLAEMVSGGVNTYSGVYFRQTADINLSNQPWLPIGDADHPFKGHFDGGSHRIDSMLVNNNTYTYIGLFGYASNGSIRNIVCDGHIVGKENYNAIIASYVIDETIQNCQSMGIINIATTQYKNSFAGIVGYAKNTTIVGCTNSASITVSVYRNIFYIGGVVGKLENGLVIDCDNIGSVNASADFSTNSYGTCAIYVGGIAGYCNTKIIRCSNVGNAAICCGFGSGTSICYVGGITAHTSDTVSYCYNIGDLSITQVSQNSISATWKNVYGISSSISTKNSYNVGTLSTLYDYHGMGNNITPTAGTIYGVSPSSTNSYYREGCGATQGGISRTEASMKSVSFPIVLNADSTVFMMDTQNINDGYPIFCPDSYTITATAQPEESGVVTGTGSYFEGSSCTLEAVANENYGFQYWTENGEIVSTESTYVFTVTGNRDLVAHIIDIGNHWEPEDNAYEDNMTLTCVVQLDGVEQVTTMLELGAFCGEECRGSQRANYFPPTNRYIIQMTIFGEVNDVISFRLYDHQQQQELQLTPPTPVTFIANGYGSLFEPYVLNFTSSVTHMQALNNGWNWWSTYIELNNNDGLNQLENSIGNTGIIIKSRTNGYVEAYEYNGETYWYGTLNSINNEQMYKIRTNAVCNATIVGDATTPSNHPINIKNGWNWIGFPCNQSVSVDVAMSSFSPENNDVIKGRNGYTTYYADGNYNMWFGTLNTFEPGKGYMYRSNSSVQKTLVFQTSRGEAIIENITSENNVFQPADENYADNMTLTAVVDLDGEKLRSEDYELAAFVGDECRGSVRLMYVEPVDRFVAFLTIFGELEEDLHFQLTDGVAVNFSTDQIAYAADGIVGSLDNPFVLHFGTLDVNENATVNVKVYPNPSDGIFNIEGQNIRKVEVFNAFGQPVYSKETENGFMKLDLTDCAVGIYLIRIITDNGVLNHQIIRK